MSVDQPVKCLAEETELLEETLQQCPYDLTRVRTWARRCGKPATNRLSYGTAAVR
jgi:hypothetical protein